MSSCLQRRGHERKGPSFLLFGQGRIFAQVGPEDKGKTSWVSLESGGPSPGCIWQLQGPKAETDGEREPRGDS